VIAWQEARRDTVDDEFSKERLVVSQFAFKNVGAGAPTYDFQLFFTSIGRGPCPDSLN